MFYVDSDAFGHPVRVIVSARAELLAVLEMRAQSPVGRGLKEVF